MCVTPSSLIHFSHSLYVRFQSMVPEADPQLSGLQRVVDLDRLVVEIDGAALIGLIHAGQYLDQRRFPGAILTEKDMDIPPADLKG